MKTLSWRELAQENLSGKIFLLPTDTVYGLHCLAGDSSGLERLREIKKRADGDKFIILIPEEDSLAEFGINPTVGQKNLLRKIWPGPYTCVFETATGKTKSFRVPNKNELRKFLSQIGPIRSTSANLPGEPTVENISQLPPELIEQIDFAVDEGALFGEPSTVLRFLR